MLQHEKQKNSYSIVSTFNVIEKRREDGENKRIIFI